MDVAEFRRRGHELVDWIADYSDHVSNYPVRPAVMPGEIKAQLPTNPPEVAEAWTDVMQDFESIILPGMTHWQHPRFFAYFPASTSYASLLAEMLTAGLGAQCMSWETSPAATELEELAVNWLGQLLGMPENFVGCIQDTASTATLCALLAAREQSFGGRSNEHGVRVDSPRTVYCSAEAHSSVEKAVRICGIGSNYLRPIPVDGLGRIRVDLLEKAVAQDLADGLEPMCIVATIGTTGVGAVDSLRDIVKRCGDSNVWIHVDAAWAGSALILPEHQSMIQGIERVDSFVFNPHKWLFTHFDCSVFFVQNREALLQAFAILPEYLRTRHDREVTNFRDWGVQLGRRFRALKLWSVIRVFGAEGLREQLRHHIALAEEFETWVRETEGFEIVVPRSLSLVCFRLVLPNRTPDEIDEVNMRLLNAINDTGHLFVTHSRFEGRVVIRFVIGQLATTAEHVRSAWQVISQTAADIVASA